MNEKRRILALFAENLSGYEAHFESDRHIWENDSGGITMCGVFCSLSHFVNNNHKRMQESELRWLFRFVEDNLNREENGIGNAIAVCFLENILNP